MKIKYSNISKLHNLKPTEMRLYLYLVKRMDQATGYVEGVYYRHVMKHAGMCKQSFYNALRGLKAKGIVTFEKCSKEDYNVLILENSFPTKGSFKKYVKLNRKAFRSRAFKSLKANEKYMIFEFLKCTHKNRRRMKIGTEEFYKKYKELFQVTNRVIRSYLHNVKKFFHIWKKGKNYIIEYRPDIFDDSPYEMNQKSEEAWCHEHLVKKECWRNHISYDEENVKNTAFLVKQYREHCDISTNDALRILMCCIQKSIDGIERKDRRLQQKYIHKLMKESLGLA